MAELAQIIQPLLQQQQEWMEKVLQQQREQQALFQRQQDEQLNRHQELMRRMISENQDHPDNSTKPSVPPFRPFDKANDRWESYIFCLGQHFEAHKVTDDKQKRAYFLSWVGSSIFDVITKLLGGKDASQEEYHSLIAMLSKHFKAKTHVLAARYAFLRTKMKPGQSYAEWVADLRGVACDCRYECPNGDCHQPFVDSLIRDAIVLHTPHDQVRTMALQQTDPSLEEVLKIAEAYETTQRSVRMIKGLEDPEEIQTLCKARGRTPRSRSVPRDTHLAAASDSCASNKSCPNCGSSHRRADCKWRNAKCRACGKSGHIASVCLTAKRDNKRNHSRVSEPKPPMANQKRPSVNTVLGEPQPMDDGVATILLHAGQKNKMFVTLSINAQDVEFQLDTGATCSMVGFKTYEALGSPPCSPTSLKLKAYGNAAIPLQGILEVTAQYKQTTLRLPLLVTALPEGTNIFGLDWFTAFNFKIEDSVEEVRAAELAQPIQSRVSSELEALCLKHNQLFTDQLGTCTLFQATLHLKPGATPKFFKPRPIPFAYLEAVKTEIDRLTTRGILKPVKTSQWAAPIVVVPKPNGAIRICGDFKVTVNSQLQVDQYPLPRPEDLFAKLGNGRHFSKIDLSDAYLQLELDEESKKLMVVNTPQGLFQYQRLPFGVASAPAIFQRFIEQLIADLSGCANYLDDIIVTGPTDDAHLKTLDEVFTRLETTGLRCNRAKCRFFQEEVEYLGYIVNADGIRPSESRVQAIQNLPRPRNVQELESFLGKLNYYNKFIEGFSHLAAPLNALRKKNARFHWSDEQDNAFQALKARIVEATKLVHYSPELPIILATDASAYGIGAVLSHRYPDGSEKPIAYASKTLSDAQRRYSQIEKEALSIIFGVKKFHQYLCGREFELLTDHQPLVSIFNPDRQLPQMTAHRLQRWAIILMGYRYRIRFRPTAKHANADMLSRLPTGPDRGFDSLEDLCLQLEEELERSLTDLPVDHQKLVAEQKRDKTLRRVHHYVMHGWPASLSTEDRDLRPYFLRRLSITLYKGTLMLDTDYSRVIVPASLRKRILDLLHEGHWGVVRMKQLARRYCWFPSIDNAIENLVSACEPCQANRANPPREFSSWPQPREAWERIHIDFAGPFWNSMWLICVDAYSSFPYISEMKSTTAEATINALQRIFVIEGLPRTLVSDNAPQLTSSQFQEFCKTNGIQHVLTAPFHPASNGEAERCVRTFKTSLRKLALDGRSKQDALQKMLSTYRASPSPRSGKSPAELLHGRQPRIVLSLVLPSEPPQDVSPCPVKTKFTLGDAVYVKTYHPTPSWVPGTVVRTLGKRVYIVQTDIGELRRHQNQLRRKGIMKP